MFDPAAVNGLATRPTFIRDVVVVTLTAPTTIEPVKTGTAILVIPIPTSSTSNAKPSVRTRSSCRRRRRAEATVRVVKGANPRATTSSNTLDGEYARIALPVAVASIGNRPAIRDGSRALR